MPTAISDQTTAKTNALQTYAQLVGLKINTEQTKIMRIHTQQEISVTLSGSDVEKVQHFIYFGSIISKIGGTDEDMKARIVKARHTSQC